MGMIKKVTTNNVKNNNNDISCTSLKISKHKINKDNIEKKNQKKKKKIELQPSDINDSLIRELRPKVYITDSSTFKSLVQHLTGNGSVSSVFPTNPNIPVDPVARKDLVWGIGTMMEELTSEGETASLSFDDYSPTSDHQQQLVFIDESSPCQSDDRSSYNISQDLDRHHHRQMSNSSSSSIHGVPSLLLEDLDTMSDLFSYQALESWLLDL